MASRRRFKQTRSLKERSLKDRLASFAKDAREKASSLPPGAEKDELLRKAGQAETTARAAAWINSPGLQPPK
jgi:hypothetical protein